MAPSPSACLRGMLPPPPQSLEFLHEVTLTISQQKAGVEQTLIASVLGQEPPGSFSCGVAAEAVIFLI